MNKIEEQTKKFLSFKQKLPSKDIDLLTTRSTHPYFSLLTYFYEKKTNTKRKNPFDNKSNTNPNLTEKIGEPKQKEKNIFISQKLNEKNKGKTTQGKSYGFNTEQTANNRGNGNKESESPIDGLNLLKIENDGMKPEKIIEMFAKQREEEKKMFIEEKNNQAKEAAEDEMKEEKEGKDDINNKEDFSFDDDEKEKDDDDKDEEDKLNPNPNNFNGSINLNLKNYESGIPVPNNGFSIFDNTKIDEEIYGENLFKDQNDSFEEKNRETFDKKNEINEDKNTKEDKKEKTKEKVKEKKSHEKEKEKEPKRSSSKICIPLDEEEKKEEKEKEKNNKNVFLKPNQVTKNIKNNSDKKKNTNNTINNNENFLEKKHNRISQSEARINTTNNKNEINNNKKDNLISSHKHKSKIISDDEEDEDISINAKNTKKNIAQKKQEEKPIMTNEGNKFIINFEANENQNKEISINIETEPENKNNKNNLNKNKNGSQNNSQKNNNLFNDYDISCVENIISILTQIKSRLNREGKEKISLQNCFDLMKAVKSDENYKKRIKDNYINVYKLLRMLFKIFSENEISSNYNNEIIAIFIHADNYYKKVKLNDNEIDSMPFYHKRKIALKYAFSKLELRNYEKQNYKELYTINNKDKDKEENDIQIKDNTKAIKFIKISKRYYRTSGIIYKEIKDFRDKLRNLQKTKSINNFLNKYENVLSDIQSSPHFMKYNKLFAHFYLVFAFHQDSKNLMKEIEEAKKKDNNNINDERKKGKSMQLNKNGIHNKRESSINSVKMKNNK